MNVYLAIAESFCITPYYIYTVNIKCSSSYGGTNRFLSNPKEMSFQIVTWKWQFTCEFSSHECL